MADGATFGITIDAEAVGADATADEVEALAASLEAAERVATPFDAALAAAESQLANASSAAADATSDLKLAEERMAGLERAATRAAKAVERQWIAGQKGRGDVAKYRASKMAAEQAAAAVQRQAAAVDRARIAANRAAGAERKLAASMRTLKNSANRSASALRGGRTEALKAGDAAGMLGGRMGELISRGQAATQVFKGMGGLGIAAVILAAAAAFVALNVAMGVAATKALMFAIANDKIAKARMDKLTERTSKAYKDLFSGLDTAPLLNAWDRFTSQLTQSTAAGQGLKTLLETMIQPFANAIEAVEPIARGMWKGAVYGALRLAIMVLRVRNAILKAIPPSAKAAIKDFASGADTLSTAFGAAEVAVYAVGAVVTALGWIFTAVGAAIVAALAVIYAPIAAVVAVVKFMVEAFQTGGQSVIAAVKRLGDMVGSVLNGIVSVAKTIGGMFSSGLAAGIEGGGSAVSSAADRVADQAIAAAQAKLQTKSPSRVMQLTGGYVSEGLAQGIEAGAPKVRSAVETMTSVVTDEADVISSSASSTTVQSSSSSSTQGGSTYHFTINATAEDGEGIVEAVERVLTRVFEGQGIAEGVSPEPEPAT